MSSQGNQLRLRHKAKYSVTSTLSHYLLLCIKDLYRTMTNFADDNSISFHIILRVRNQRCEDRQEYLGLLFNGSVPCPISLPEINDLLQHRRCGTKQFSSQTIVTLSFLTTPLPDIPLEHQSTSPTSSNSTISSPWRRQKAILSDEKDKGKKPRYFKV